jgi:tetratricopeptide (TPR) repeat protein
MRKLVLSVILFIAFGTVLAQEPIVTWEDLVKKKEKSDIEIADASKNLSTKTWLKRGDLFYQIAVFNTAGLYQGMTATGTFQSADVINGIPDSKETTNVGEIWVYPRKKLFFEDGKLVKWEETEYIDKDAMLKSGEAYIKADELDPKKTLKDKSTFKNSISTTRSGLLNLGVEFYNIGEEFIAKNDSEKAKESFITSYKYMNLAYTLGEFPKASSDTIFDASLINYYLGIISLKAGLSSESRAKLKKSIELNYEPGASFHYMAETYLTEGDSLKYIETVKEGFDKYPSEEQLLIDLINFYLSQNKIETVLQYLDIAIAKNPSNPSYYSAKGTVFFNTFDVLIEKYTKYKEEANEMKKKAFRDRENEKLRVEDEKLKDENLVNAQKVYDEILSNFALAEDLYIKSLEVDPKFFNSAFNLGSLYVKKSRLFTKEGEYQIKIFKDFAKSDELTAKSNESLKVAAEKFEIANKIDPKDRDVLTTLKSIYYKLKDNSNLERIQGEIDKLGANNESKIK